MLEWGWEACSQAPFPSCRLDLAGSDPYARPPRLHQFEVAAWTHSAARASAAAAATGHKAASGRQARFFG